MTKEDLWNLFRVTGNVSYYIKYKKMDVEGINMYGDNES